jgi:hypothetical protein
MRKSKSNKAIAGQDNHHDVIDLASSITEAKAANNTSFLCKYCIGPLLPYPKNQIDNPHAGPSYICTKCGTVVDSSLEKLPKASKKVVSSIGSPQNVAPFIEMVPENATKGLNPIEDEYAEVNARFEPNEDEQIRAMGGTIIDSRIALTDSQGHNKTLVRRDDTPRTDTSYY